MTRDSPQVLNLCPFVFSRGLRNAPAKMNGTTNAVVSADFAYRRFLVFPGLRNVVLERCRAMRTYFYSVGAVLALPLAGCEPEERLKVYPVQGKVLVVGTPAGNASVFFYPCDPAQQRVPTATTAADGTFSLTTVVWGDGAPRRELRRRRAMA